MRRRLLRESLGFVAVSLSLVFVGLEVRQNTTVARAEAYRDVAIFTAEWVTNAAEDREWLALYRWMREGEVLADFSEAEQNLAAWRLEAVFRQAEIVWRQVEEGILPPHAMSLLLSETLSLPYAREMWPISRPDMPDDFAAFMDAWLETVRWAPFVGVIDVRMAIRATRSP